MSFKFEELKVWQKSIDFSFAIHSLTVTFPKEELFVLTNQIKRAADSIALNIAEGSTGQSDAEFSKFLGYSVRSAIEVVSCLYIAEKRSLIDKNSFTKLYSEAEQLIVMLQSLRKKLNN